MNEGGRIGGLRGRGARVRMRGAGTRGDTEGRTGRGGEDGKARGSESH